MIYVGSGAKFALKSDDDIHKHAGVLGVAHAASEVV